MCKHLFENNEIFKTNISDLLLDLAYDNIVNFRIILAQFLCGLIKKEKYVNVKKNETVRKIIKILKNDKDEEIQNIIKDINNVEDIEVELNKEVNQKFKDNMKFVSSEFGITRNVPLNSKFSIKTISSKTTSNNIDNQENSSESKKEKTE